MSSLSNEVLWIFSLKNPMYLPSYIVSGILPANYLKIQKIIFLEDHDPSYILNKHNPKLIIIGKGFHFNLKNLINEARKRNIKVISIFDDWHFVETEINKNQFILNTYMAKHSNKIVVKTSAAAEIIKKNTGIVSNIISDCIRFNSLKPIQKINYPFKIAWFGMHTNHDTIRLAFNEIKLTDKMCDINIITNNLNQLENSLSEYKDIPNINYKLTQWSKDLSNIIEDCDIIIIPYINDHIRYVKSYNRILDSLNMGRFIIMSKAKQFDRFKKFCYQGNIGDGINWLAENEKLVFEMINKGQSYVKKNYNLEKISKKWMQIIKQTID